MRSGTTLLRLMLDHHPRLCIFGEFEYAVNWITDRGPPPLSTYHRLLEFDRVFRKAKLQIDPQLGYEELVRSFLEQATSRSGKPIGGATVHSNFDHLPRMWPDARYIHLVRDPRDVARSSVGMGWVGNVWYGAQYWREPVERWCRFASTLPDTQKHQLRFEDLIDDPQRELTGICHFLGIPFEARMLNYHVDSTYNLPDRALSEQWRKKMTAEEVQWVESVCHPWMAQFGYQLTSDRLAPPRGLRSCQLTAQHRLRRVSRNLGIYGLPLYVRWQLAKRLPHCHWKKQVLQQVDRVNEARLK
jgi:hypothetical protein